MTVSTNEPSSSKSQRAAISFCQHSSKASNIRNSGESILACLTVTNKAYKEGFTFVNSKEKEGGVGIQLAAQ